jgi:hypothetical protein
MPKIEISRASIFTWSIIFLFLTGLVSGCKGKQKIKIQVPSNIQNDKTADYDALIQIIRQNNEQMKKINSLLAPMHITLTLGKKESGLLEQYKHEGGHIRLRRPNDLWIDIIVLSTAALELTSKGEDFGVWVRGKGLYSGKNSAKGELVPENSNNGKGYNFPGRPNQILRAIWPEPVQLDSPEIGIWVEEQSGADFRYYVLCFSRAISGNRRFVLRKIWIERTGLTIAREQKYTEGGKLVSDIQYSHRTQADGFLLPNEIDMDRPLDGYSVKLEIDQWQVNPSLSDKFFEINRPGAEEIRLVEKKPQ